MNEKVGIDTIPDKGLCIYAKHTIHEGELIAVTIGPIFTNNQMESFPKPLHAYQVEMDLHMVPPDLDNLTAIFCTNHSCNPNAGLRNAASLVALRKIEIGEEICFDYAMCDCTLGDKPTVIMTCKCNTPECRHAITDMDWRMPDLRQKYKGYFSTYLQEIIDKEFP